ncbi:MAG: UDP-2,3-diacylglucosamine diphosphatase [Campylobacterota bacterium]
MYHNLKLKKSAIFIADSHFNKNNQEFLEFLEKLKSDEIKTSQLILMGDIFDFISGESRYFLKINNRIIKLLNKLSRNLQIVYLEGNHDYNLKKIFKDIYVIPRHKQPLVLKYKEKNIALSHGDNFTDWKYNLYCKVIRNSFLLKFLNLIDFDFFISKKIENALLNKNICHHMENFEQLAKKRVKNYNESIVIEGHFHQGKSYIFEKQRYINVPSLCCSKEYMVFENSDFIKKDIL